MNLFFKGGKTPASASIDASDVSVLVHNHQGEKEYNFIINQIEETARFFLN
jgi:hypothetical protein